MIHGRKNKIRSVILKNMLHFSLILVISEMLDIFLQTFTLKKRVKCVEELLSQRHMKPVTRTPV